MAACVNTPKTYWGKLLSSTDLISLLMPPQRELQCSGGLTWFYSHLWFFALKINDGSSQIHVAVLCVQVFCPRFDSCESQVTAQY